MKSKFCLVSVLFLFAWAGHAQKAKKEPLKHEAEIRNMVNFFQYLLNTLGDEKTAARDKDVLVTQSYGKIFLDSKVQIEDDLDEDRTVITNKDVQAYLKDVDFFFKDVKFDFAIEDIQLISSEAGKLTYKISLTRNIKGVTSDGKSVNTTKPRYIEVNYNEKDQDLKIVSVYTNQFNQKRALFAWWNELSFEWQSFFRGRFDLPDSVLLADLKRIISVDSLDISGNEYVLNIQPLAELVNLRALNISDTHVSDLSPIRNLTELVDLNFSNTPVSDITSLRYSTNLQVLNFHHTPVVKVDVLEKLLKLERLDASHTHINDFEFISNLTLLADLNLESTPLADLAVIDSLTTLRRLNVAHTSITTLPIGQLSNLEMLNIDSTGATDLSNLASLTKLTAVHINHTGVADLDPLLALPELERVYCDHSGVNQETANRFMMARPNTLVIFDSEDLRGWWEDLTNVWRDVLRRSAKTSYGPSKEELAIIANLDSLDVSNYVSIKSLDPLKRLPKLKIINASKTGITDLSPLRDHTALYSLNVSETRVSDLNALRSLTNLRRLNIDRTSVRKFQPLESLKSLEIVYADDDETPDSIAFSFLENRQSCLLIYKTVRLRAWWSGLPNEWKQIFQTQVKMNAMPSREDLHRIAEIRNLSFSDVAISDLSPLLQLPVLNDLQISGTQIKDVSPIGSVASLQKLKISNSPLRDLTSLRSLKALSALDVSGTSVTDLQSLEALPLVALNCSGTQIRKLELEKIKTLEYLDCSNTAVRNLSPLKDLPLKSLKCFNTKISRKEIEAYKKHHPDCVVVFY
jgi:hypothetical protein